MAFELSKDDKQVREYGDRLPFGITIVQFTNATPQVSDAGKDFIEVTVVDENGTEDNARFYFVGGAANISFNNLRTLGVHLIGSINAKAGEEAINTAKETIREKIENVSNSDELADILNDNCTGGFCWFTKLYDPERTYTNSQGEVKRSINTNVLGYEPKERPELMPAPVGQTSGNKAVDDTFGGGQQQASGTVPDSWSN